MQCITCGKPLSSYDIGFYKKLAGRGATRYACIACTCAYFRITETQAWEMIRRLQQNGCTLFPPPESN